MIELGEGTDLLGAVHAGGVCRKAEKDRAQGVLVPFVASVACNGTRRQTLGKDGRRCKLAVARGSRFVEIRMDVMAVFAAIRKPGFVFKAALGLRCLHKRLLQSPARLRCFGGWQLTWGIAYFSETD